MKLNKCLVKNIRLQLSIGNIRDRKKKNDRIRNITKKKHEAKNVFLFFLAKNKEIKRKKGTMRSDSVKMKKLLVAEG